MANSILVAIPGKNVLTETDPDNFALFADQAVDYILIKEKARGTINVGGNNTQNIAHGLNYVPFCLAFAEVSPGVWRKLFGTTIDGANLWFEVNDTNIVFHNESGTMRTFSYYLFYDNIT